MGRERGSADARDKLARSARRVATGLVAGVLLSGCARVGAPGSDATPGSVAPAPTMAGSDPPFGSPGPGSTVAAVTRSGPPVPGVATDPALTEEVRLCIDRKAAGRAHTTSPGAGTESAAASPEDVQVCTDEVDQLATFLEGLTETGLATPDQAQCVHDAIRGFDDVEATAFVAASRVVQQGGAAGPVIGRTFSGCGISALS